MKKGQGVLNAMIVVYAVVTLILAATNVMLVMLASLIFLHVQVRKTITNCIDASL